MSWIYGMIVILIQIATKSTTRNQHVVSATPLLQGKERYLICFGLVLDCWFCVVCAVHKYIAPNRLIRSHYMQWDLALCISLFLFDWSDWRAAVDVLVRVYLRDVVWGWCDSSLNIAPTRSMPDEKLLTWLTGARDRNCERKKKRTVNG